MTLPVEIMRREQLQWAHEQLVKNKLIAWTSGNCSVRFGPEAILIKPSGVMYEDLTEDNYVLVGMDGEYPEGPKPSTDTASHLYIYRHIEDIGAIVHTHSPAAVACSVYGKTLEATTTEFADNFGPLVPCAEYAEIGSEAMGAAAVKAMKDNYQARAVLLANHGVLTFGGDLREAIKRAVMLEHCCDIMLRARQFETIRALTVGEAWSCHSRYQSYGQPG